MKNHTEKKIFMNLPLKNFINLLKDRGFQIGADHYLKVINLLKSLDPECPPNRLKFMLCPLFAVNKKEQDLFYKLFDLHVNMEKQIKKSDVQSDNAQENFDTVKKSKKIFYILPNLIILFIIFYFTYQPDIKIEPVKIEESSFQVSKQNEVRKKLKITITNVPKQQQEKGIYDQFGLAFRWTGIIMPFVIFLFYELYKIRKRKFILERQAGKKPPYEWFIMQYTEPDTTIFTGRKFYSAAKDMRKRLKSNVYQVSIHETIFKTIKNFGFPSFMYKSSTYTPEYLALINMPEFRNHQSNYADAIINALKKQDIYIERYYYKYDPRIYFKESKGKRIHIEELQAVYPNHRLIFMGTGDDLLDPFTCKFEPWAEIFKNFKSRALLSFRRPSEWGIRETALAENFIVLPCNDQGFNAMVRLFEDDNKKNLWYWIKKNNKYPELPLEHELSDIDTLKKYLGQNTYNWLCGCAVYPELHWNLTLSIGLKLQQKEKIVTQDNLLRLISLPWFKNGEIPNNIRLKLIDSLDQENSNIARQAIISEMQKYKPKRDTRAYDAYNLNIAVQRWALDPENIKLRKAAKKAKDKLPDEQISHDYTLLKVLETVRSPLKMILPEPLAKLFFKNKLSFFGFNTIFRFFLTLSIVLASFIVIKSPEPVESNQDEKIKSFSMDFVYVPPGKFMMGSPENEPGRDDDEKRHEVTLTKGFYIQTTEFTQGQWKAVMGNNPSGFKECGDDCPVENVSWEEVDKFIQKLNELKNMNFRIPTEAEWEYAARAGSTTAFANGEIKEIYCGLDPNLDKMGWYCGNSNNKTHPVANKQPNAWGIYDMHGNVYEWCTDWYGDYTDDNIDPHGPYKGSGRVIRGGSFLSNARDCRSANRNRYSPSYRYDLIGFRLVFFQFKQFEKEGKEKK